ncbi:hypothetical protein Q8F55_003374 [Vanrija albida]|uniref:Uncharacterized protein n=1 Tax=Vanrija albida TaxID=181172 RepID=A0ABR3Q3T5_9TREE
MNCNFSNTPNPTTLNPHLTVNGANFTANSAGLNSDGMSRREPATPAAATAVRAPSPACTEGEETSEPTESSSPASTPASASGPGDSEADGENTEARLPPALEAIGPATTSPVGTVTDGFIQFEGNYGLEDDDDSPLDDDDSPPDDGDEAPVTSDAQGWPVFDILLTETQKRNRRARKARKVDSDSKSAEQVTEALRKAAELRQQVSTAASHTALVAANAEVTSALIFNAMHRGFSSLTGKGKQNELLEIYKGYLGRLNYFASLDERLTLDHISIDTFKRKFVAAPTTDALKPGAFDVSFAQLCKATYSRTHFDMLGSVMCGDGYLPHDQAREVLDTNHKHLRAHTDYWVSLRGADVPNSYHLSFKKFKIGFIQYYKELESHLQVYVLNADGSAAWA